MALSNVSKDHTLSLLEELSAGEIMENRLSTKIKTQHSSIAKLECLYKQLLFVKKEIENVLEEAHISANLNEVSMKCKKYPGQTYYLYKNNNQCYLSKLSPKDYNYTQKDTYLGAYKLKIDYTWEKLE